jgi:hypothetical protein
LVRGIDERLISMRAMRAMLFAGTFGGRAPAVADNAAVPDQLSLRAALRAATSLAIDPAAIDSCLDLRKDADVLFARARVNGLASLERKQRAGHLSRVIGEVAESVVEIVLAEVGLQVFWHITTPGVHGVDLLFLGPDECVLALEVKGTLRAGRIPRLTPSRLRQMSREWLNQPDNPAMADWQLGADDLYAGVAVVDLATAVVRVAVSGDFEAYRPITGLAELTDLRALI